MCAQRLANSVGVAQEDDSSRSTNDSDEVPERLPEENLSAKSPANDSANASGTGQSSTRATSKRAGWFDKTRKVEE